MGVRKRLFLVGCPRSGTTLLQSLIAAHPDVASFPESHFFVQLYSTRRWMRGLGLASRRARSNMESYFNGIGAKTHYDNHAPPLMLRAVTVCLTFVRTLDDLARRKGSTLWLEKTPRHLHHIADIESLVPETHVIHLLRRGEDTIASLYHAMNTYEQKWGGPVTLGECYRRWKHDIECSLEYVDEPGHTLVTYEQVVNRTESTLRQIADDAGFTYDPSMTEDYAEVSDEVIQSDEEWKEETGREIVRSRSTKFQQLFDKDEQREIAERVQPLNEIIRNQKAVSPSKNETP